MLTIVYPYILLRCVQKILEITFQPQASWMCIQVHLCQNEYRKTTNMLFSKSMKSSSHLRFNLLYNVYVSRFDQSGRPAIA